MLKGLVTTLKEFFNKPVTISYPEEKREVRRRFRGRHKLQRYANGLERCIGCSLSGRIEIECDPSVVASLIQHLPNRWMVDTAGPQVLV